MTNQIPRFLRAACLVLIFFIGIKSAFAANWSAPAEQLARKIAAVTGPGAVTVDVLNQSSLDKNESDDIRRQLLAQLASMGLRFVESEQAAATVHVTLSENLDSYVWVAEIHQGTNEPALEMVSLPRPDSAGSTRELSAFTLHKTLLWSQADPILDVAVLDGNPPHLVILEPNQVVLYRFQDSHWQREQEFAIAHSRPWPRDMRGRLVTRKDHLLDAYLPGVLCQSGNHAPLALHCRESDDSWPLGNDLLNLNAFYAPARNFFTGVLVPGVGKQTSAPAFFSAAVLPRVNYTLWLFAALDGQIHMLDGVTEQTVRIRGWGDEIASLRTTCGSGWQVLASSNASGDADSVRAYEIADREPAPVSQPIELNGSMTSLWAATDGTTAFGVSRNSQTEKYEAFRLSLSCTQ